MERPLSSAPGNLLQGLYEASARELHDFILRRIGPQEAEDVMQETYLNLIRHGSADLLDRPRAFLFRTAANLAIDTLRKRSTLSRYTQSVIDLDIVASEAPGPEDRAEGVIALERFRAALNELPPHCRDALLLSRMDGLPYSEIAKRLGVSVRSVERYIVKALEHLRTRLER